MRVLITGGTGFVGAWTAKAAADARHEVRFLVRDPRRLDTSAAALGVDTSDHVVGDITDRASVEEAIEGCAAAVHCAAVVSTDKRRADDVRATNLVGAHNVLGAALDAGLDPVIHVSSITALFRPNLPVMHADLPVTGGADAYGRSKAAVDHYARELQDRDAPVVITYPGMVMGPPAGERFGEVAEGVEAIVNIGLVPSTDGAWTVVDVRDLAALHVAALQPGRGPRRYMAGGHHLPSEQLGRLLTEASGRQVRVLPVPGWAIRNVGRTADLFTRFLPVQTVMTEAAMDYYTRMPASDDRPSIEELGVTYRDPRETFVDTVDGLVACGRVPAARVRCRGRA